MDQPCGGVHEGERPRAGRGLTRRTGGGGEGQLSQPKGEKGGVNLGGGLNYGNGAESAGAERAAQRIGSPHFADEVAPGFAAARAAGGGVGRRGGAVADERRPYEGRRGRVVDQYIEVLRSQS